MSALSIGYLSDVQYFCCPDKLDGMPECQLVYSWRSFALQPAIFIVWLIAIIIRQAGSLIDSYQFAWAQRQADFDPEKLIQRL
jgi:hypothetical protein